MKRSSVVIVIGALLVFLTAVVFQLCYNTPTEVEPTDRVVSREELRQDPIYYASLSETEQKIYDTLCEHAKNYTAGFIQFPEAINMASFQNIQDAFLADSPYGGYTIVFFPMTANYVFTATQGSQEDAAMAEQCILWVYGSAFSPDDMVVENNQLQNVEQCKQSLGEVDPEIKEETLTKYETATEKLDQVVSELPETFSQMEAIKHFVTWTSQNLNPIPLQSEPYLDFNDMAIHYQSPSSLLCVSNKDSLCLGYAKVFQYLCEKAGIRCDIVLGTRRTNQGGHAINKIYFGDEGFYVDVSELRNANFINYMTQQKAKAYMAPAYPELF